MTAILHTADVHLRDGDPERLNALEAVLERGESLNVDVVTIGGDLFDREADVDALRNELRNRFFTDRPFDVLLIPGNHDVAAFRDELFFGEACTVIPPGETFGTWSDESISIVALPYQETLTDELVASLDARPDTERTEILLFHGSLDAPIGADTGEEDAYRYFPVTESELVDLGFDFYLAGHYHGPHRRQIGETAELAYPGTPVSTRTSEVGRRQVVHLEGGRLHFEPLDTPHYLEHQLTVTPGHEDEAIDRLETWVDRNVTANASPRIRIDGVVDMPEETFVDRLAGVVESGWLESHWLSVEHVSSHPVIEEFERRLAEESVDEATRRAIRLRTLRAASSVASMGRGWR